ncbi:stage V sporulation protein B [Pseudalkalibacillus berkeleyi]|uniref:Stage V sporulation protein B n=1 Tax=Pseudalkalibacillus berkeleyi TaxID=1069813 RepID=A0ABS9H2P1_9BACL|nr:stage V sporulation protein B [Pseudalkalibacillus berkeleyi]MCF6138068.1 stage V sporulation protein B [Pseudalkalibacillus berkeleyi]
MSKQTFIQGTLILIVAGLITKVLGFINRIVIARIIGVEGVGLYMMAVPTLLLTITLTRLGLPVAISKMVAEADAQRNHKKIKQILVVSLTITGTLSIIFTTAMIALAPILSQILKDERTYYPLVAIAPVVPIVALSSVIRGYFQGRQNMKPSAYSQVIEQIVRITLVAVLTAAFLPYGIEYAAAGAMVSVVIGELASLLYMFSMFKLQKRIKIRKGFFDYVTKGKETFNQLMRISLPTTASQLVGSVSYFFEPIVVATSLSLAGVTTVLATQQYGALAGYVIPFLTLPMFITYSLSVSLIPAISEAAAQKKHHVVEHRLNQALRISMLSGGISVVITYVLATPLMDLMYGTPEVAVYVKLMAPFFFFLYFQGPLQAVLQALDLAKAAMTNSIIGAIIKIIAIYLLATRPDLGIMGVALAIVINVVLVTLLHFSTIVKAISYTVVVKDYVKGILAIAITALAVTWFTTLLDKSLLADTLITIGFAILIYLILILSFNLVKKEDVQYIPFLKKIVR